jgi:hypothetical protein
MKRIAVYTLSGLLMCSLACATAWAQATGQISGTVKDPSGAVLPGVEVKATQTDTGAERTTVTNETGYYVLQNLPTGPYRLEVSLPGFRTYVQTGIALAANAYPEINPILEVGQVAETVEVQANVTQVEVRSLAVREVIETQQILELPLNGRTATDLIVLAGAAVQQGTNSSREIGGGRGFSVTGLQNTSVTYTLDGAMHNNPYNNLNLPVPFPDALQEFSVQVGTQNAANGFLGGAQVGAVTKSGTNEFHGAIFDFMRNDKFKARGYFDTTKGTQKRNQFGGTLGGPIVRQKLFFFFGYQGTLNRQNPDQDEDYVPTARMLQGDFSEAIKPYVDPSNRDLGGCRTTLVNATGSGATPGQLRGPFANNRVDPSLFSKAALNLVARLPKPIDECGLVRHSVRNQSDSHELNGKIDYNRSANHSIFGRFMLVPESRSIPHNFNPDNILNVGTGGASNLGSFYTLGDTYLISPVTINNARLAVNRTAIHRLGPDFFSITELGVKAYSYLPKHTQLSVTGGNGFSLGGGTESEASFNTTTYQISDDVSMVRGAHQISAGGTLAHWRSNSYANVRSTGIYSFNGEALTGYGMADFLLGRPSNVRQAVPNQLTMSQWYAGLYLQDSWKMTSRLSINAGLRWEPYFPQQQRDGHIYNFDYDRMLNGVKSAQFLNAPAGFYYPGDPGFPGKSGLYKNWKALGPRVGLGWDATGDGKTSVRAGYGISYDFVNAQYHLNTNIAPPFGNDISTTPASFDDPWATYPGGNPFPSVFDKNARFNLNGAFLSMPYNINTTYVQTWNLTVQRQLPNSLFFSAAYNGNGTRHLWSTYPLNPAIYIPGSNCTLPNGRRINGTCSTTGADNVNERRLLSLSNYEQIGRYIGPLDSYDDGGTASYHGMTLTLNRRTRSLNVSSNYTWSRCIGTDGTAGTTPNVNTGSNYTTVVGGRSFFTDRRADVANCNTDRRHIFNSTAVFEMPRFQGRFLSWIASGWRISNIYRRSSGGFTNVTAGTDAARIGGNTGAQRAVQLSSDVYAPGRPSGPRQVYLNPGTFAVPETGTLAPNRGRRNIEGPGTWDWDAALSRIFRVKEGQEIEFRAEAYNVSNSFRPANPNVVLNSSNFGLIVASRATRDMQFALKYKF